MEDVSTLCAIIPEKVLQAFAEQLGLSSTQNETIQATVFLGTSAIFQRFLGVVSGVECMSKISMTGFNIQQIKKKLTKVHQDLKKLMNVDAETAMDLLSRGDYKNAGMKAVSGFRASSTVEHKIICTKIKIVTDIINGWGDSKFERENNGEIQNVQERLKMIGHVLKRSLDDLLDDPMHEQTWAKTSSLIPGTRNQAKDCMQEVQRLLSLCYKTLSVCEQWTKADSKIAVGVLGSVTPKYLPVGEMHKVCLNVGRTEDCFVRLEVYKTKEDTLRSAVYPTEQFPQAKIDCEPVQQIMKKPSDCQDVTLHIVVSNHEGDTLTFKLSDLRSDGDIEKQAVIPITTLVQYVPLDEAYDDLFDVITCEPELETEKQIEHNQITATIRKKEEDICIVHEEQVLVEIQDEPKGIIQQEEAMDTEDSDSDSRSSAGRFKKGATKNKYKKEIRGRDSSSSERYTRRTMKKKPQIFSNNEVPRIVMLGTTGAGKSSLGNCLLGDKRFRVSRDPRSCTEEPSDVERGFWYGDGEEFELIDTPGLNDSEGRDTEHIVDIIETLKKGGFINTFLIVRNGHETRMSKHYTDMLSIFELMFGETFWKQVVFDVSFGNNSKKSAKLWIDEIKIKFPNAASAKLKTVFMDIKNQNDDDGFFMHNLNTLWKAASTMPNFECKDMKAVKAENDLLSSEKIILAQEKDELELRMQSLMMEKSNEKEEYERGLQDAQKKAEQDLMDERRKLEEGKKEEIQVIKDQLKMKETELHEISTKKDAEVMKAKIEKKELEIQKNIKERFDQEKNKIIMEYDEKLAKKETKHRSELEIKVKEVKDQTLEQESKMQEFKNLLQSREQEICQLRASEIHREQFDEEISNIKKGFEDMLRGKDCKIQKLESELKKEKENFVTEKTRIQMEKLESERSKEAQEKVKNQERNNAFIQEANQSEEEFAKSCPALLSKRYGSTPAKDLVEAVTRQMDGNQRFRRNIDIPLKKDEDIKNRLGGIAARVFDSMYPSGVDPNEPSYLKNLKRAAAGLGWASEGSVGSRIKKTIMLLGLTGSGKTTFIDAFINYIFDVRFEDPKRLRLIQLTREERDKKSYQAKSQTDHIVVYNIKALPSMNINYDLTIIDTPGFGDTRGIEYDKNLMHNIEDLFKSKKIDSLDAICFVAKAGDARLTAQQKYIFESIFHIFGNDVKDNLLSILTNYDGHSVNILDSFTEADMNFVQNIPVNSTAIFQPICQGPVNRKALLNNPNMLTYQKFFESSERLSNTILTMTPKTLELTLDVLRDREHIEVEMAGLQWSINELLMKKDMIQQETDICNRHALNMKANEDTEYEVEEQQMKKVELDPGRFVTNCLECNRTCHYPCGIPSDLLKARCAAMNKDGSCSVCPQKCNWTKHVNSQYKIEFDTKKVKKTYKEVIKRHQEYMEKHKGQKTIVDALKEEAELVSKEIQKRVAKITECLKSLKQNALRPDSTNSADYIEQMISAEDREKKPGYRERIMQLRDEKDRAENLAKIQAGEEVQNLLEKK